MREDSGVLFLDVLSLGDESEVCKIKITELVVDLVRNFQPVYV